MCYHRNKKKKLIVLKPAFQLLFRTVQQKMMHQNIFRKYLYMCSPLICSLILKSHHILRNFNLLELLAFFGRFTKKSTKFSVCINDTMKLLKKTPKTPRKCKDLRKIHCTFLSPKLSDIWYLCFISGKHMNN